MPPKKRSYKTDTPALRKRVLSGRVSKDQLTGPALTYYNRVQGAAKARKAKADGTLQIGNAVVPKNSDLYAIIKAGAEAKGQSVKQFVKENKEALEKLMTDGDIVLQRETDYLIKDLQALSRGKKVFVNDGNGFSRFKKENAIFNLQTLKMHASATTDIFLIYFRVSYKTKGDIYFYCPELKQYEGMIGQSFELFLDDYYPEITYVKSNRKGKE